MPKHPDPLQPVKSVHQTIRMTFSPASLSPRCPVLLLIPAFPARLTAAPVDGDVVEFALHGDSAPDRRFNYRYGGNVTEERIRQWTEAAGLARKSPR